MGQPAPDRGDPWTGAALLACGHVRGLHLEGDASSPKRLNCYECDDSDEDRLRPVVEIAAWVRPSDRVEWRPADEALAELRELVRAQVARPTNDPEFDLPELWEAVLATTGQPPPEPLVKSTVERITHRRWCPDQTHMPTRGRCARCGAEVTVEIIPGPSL